MTQTSDLDRVTMIVLRYMRRLLFVYSIGIMGMALMPGQVVDGGWAFAWRSILTIRLARCCEGVVRKRMPIIKPGVLLETK